MPSPTGLRALALWLLVLGVLASTGAARARANAATPAPPSSLALGFNDDFRFEEPSASMRGLWLGRAESLGAGWVKLGVYWKQIAPAQPPPGFDPSNAGDPSYNWSGLDDTVRAAADDRLHILLMLYQPPNWALGARVPASALALHSWRPSAAALGQFAHAVAERYSGRFPDPSNPRTPLPRVSHFQAWNEPNLAVQITPQWTRTRTGSVPASPQIYRGLLNAVYTNVKAVQPRAFVLAAGTAPYGDPPGGDRMRPVVFWRELLCLHGASMRRERCPHPAHLDGLDHHPYAANPVVPAHNRDDVSVPDFRKLWGVLDVAERDHTVLPAGPKPFWMTELEWASRPPDPSGAPPTIQARYLELAFYELWRQGVSHVFWYTISDSPFGSGLYFDDGTPKPAAVAFRFPFVAVATRPGAVTLWGVAPRGGAVTIERVKGHRWQRLVTIRARAGAVFEQRVRLRRNSLLRARIGDLGSLPWPAGWHP